MDEAALTRGELVRAAGAAAALALLGLPAGAFAQPAAPGGASGSGDEAKPAYGVVTANVTDRGRYGAFEAAVAAAARATGGRVVSGDMPLGVAEGRVRPDRMTLLLWPSLRDARACVRSPDFARARDLARGVGEVSVILVEAV